MSVEIVHRPARVTAPVETPAEIVLAPPPQMSEGSQGFPLQTLLPVIGSLSSITMIVLLRNNPIFVVIGAVILVVALAGAVVMAFTSRGAQARQRRLQRERYLDYLEELREDLRVRGDELRDESLVRYPSPAALVEISRDPARRWERRPHDADFLHARIGRADIRALPVALPPEQNPVQPFDPIMKGAAERMVRLAGVVQGMPAVVDLSRGGHVSVVGDRVSALQAVRATVAQLATFHSPDDLHLAAVFPEDRAADWRGFDLLPHVVSASVVGPSTGSGTGVGPSTGSGTGTGPSTGSGTGLGSGTGPSTGSGTGLSTGSGTGLGSGTGPSTGSGTGTGVRRVAPSVDDLIRLLRDELRDRAASAAAARRAGRKSRPVRLVVVVDEGDHAATGFPRLDAAFDLAELGITVVHVVDDRLKEPSAVSARVTVAGPEATIETPGDDDATVRGIRVDPVDAVLLEVVARPLAPLRLTRSSAVESDSALAPDVTELLGLADVDAIDTSALRRTRSTGDFLRVPIGVDDGGRAVLLDLKESAQQGYGPHGICIGATGSGKSELLRTLILGLALTHAPDDLSMILVDYKGGAAFAPFARLPHVAGIIDNLADDPQLTERARASIQGEVVRRQQLLKQADNSPSITHYRALRAERPDLPPLPHLFLVIDEFGELLAAEPDFVDLLLTIGRIGRSIGVHLLLSSQRIEAGRLRGLDTYLSYRIGLRTFSESESVVVLERPDAFHLPAIPGFGFLKVDTSVYTRFRAGYVSGAVPDAAAPVSTVPVLPEVRPLPVYDVGAHSSGVPGEGSVEPAVVRPFTGRTLVGAAVSRLDDGTPPTRPVWLPPLPTGLTLGGVLPSSDGEHPAEGLLRAPIGLLDDPTTQRQEPWLLDLTRSGGHVTITGAPQSGRSTFLRTLAVSLAFTHTPREVSVYGMDLTGGGLGRIDGFPHVGGVATRGHGERLGRLLEELTGMLAVREDVFRRFGIDSLADMRRQHAAGRLPELPSADVVLLVDGYGALRSDFEELEAPIGQLLERGGSFGIHVVMTLTRWNELRMNLQGLVGTRLELGLNDPGDSQIARKLSATLRSDQPGRVLTDEKLFAQIALPVLDEVEDDSLGEAVEELARQSAGRWAGPGAAPIRLLPDNLAPDSLPDALAEPEVIPVGLRQDTMEPVALDLTTRDQHVLVLGDTGCGKTTLLRGIIQGAIDRYSPEELVIGLMDTRGDLAGDIPDAYLGGHATSGLLARQLAESIAAELDKRQGDRDSGPRILVVADDFDILAAGGAEPLRPLLPYLASARDLRLNVVVSRPVSGASRAMFDVALQSVRDVGGSVVVMSGERSEGQLVPKLYAEPMIAGRGRLARRGQRPTLVQIARFIPAPVPEPTPVPAPAATPVPEPVEGRPDASTSSATDAPVSAPAASPVPEPADPPVPGSAPAPVPELVEGRPDASTGSATDPPGSATDASTGSATDPPGSATDPAGSATEPAGSATDSPGSATDAPPSRRRRREADAS